MSARVGDKVQSQGSTCSGGSGCPTCPHPWTGTILTGAQFINGKLAARLTDKGVIECPHGGQFIIIEGSSDVIIEGQPGARLQDKVQCIKCGGLGLIIGSSPDTFTNNK